MKDTTPEKPTEQPAQTLEVKPGEWSKQDQKIMEYALPVNRSGWAIACGYLALFCVVPLLNFVFVPLTYLSAFLGLRDLKKNPTRKGKGRIIFGLVMASLSLAVTILIIVIHLSTT